MLLNVCLLFFEKIAGAPHGQKHKYCIWAPRHRKKNIMNLGIGLFKAPLSNVE